MLPLMSVAGHAAKPHIAIVGAGNLGSALALSLRQAGYVIDAIVGRSGGTSLKQAHTLAKKVGAHVVVGRTLSLQARLVWFCVPDSAIEHVAQELARPIEWKGRIALHSSGALTSDELSMLRDRGAAVASAHPMMTFVRGSHPSLRGVPFAIEGDRAAVRAARQIVRDLGGEAFAIRKSDKAAYHAWGTFASPLFTALLATNEHVAALAGIDRLEAKRRMIPILRQTLENYASFDAGNAFSGPLIRGDVDTVNRHLRVLRRTPIAYNVYRSLALAAVAYLPGKHKAGMQRALRTK
jgi:predicted short-subunit dehydrogenase-like oxidoreductase (DUF2520 family)